MNAQATPQQHVAGFGPDQIDIAELAAAIADESSVVDICSCCHRFVSGQHEWYDLKSTDLSEWHHVDRAVAYLDRRGEAAATRLIRCKTFPTLVRFEESAS